MSGFQIVVCGSIVPDPLQTLEPVTTPAGPGLKNELMLPAVLDPWAGHALYEAASLAAKTPGSKLWLVALGPKAKLQQVMMAIAQKVPFELVALDGPAGGFVDAFETAAALADAVKAIPGLDRTKLLLFGGWESASRCAGAPAVLGWATGNLPEPRNNPQVGMANMKTVMPALMKAKPAPVGVGGIQYREVALPKVQRETRIVKDLSTDEIARELVEWIAKD